MGRIVAQVVVTNALDTTREVRCDALVDTGTSGLILPSVWRERLGAFAGMRTVDLETADPRVVRGEVCGPVRITLEGFDTIFNEVTFLDMHPEDGRYEPLVGYIILEQSRAAVDMVGQRLVPVKYMDLK